MQALTPEEEGLRPSLDNFTIESKIANPMDIQSLK
jgi:hypothetical protein